MTKLFTCMIAILASLLLTGPLYAKDFVIPITVDGQTITVTATVEDGAVITATSPITTVQIGEIVAVEPPVLLSPAGQDFAAGVFVENMPAYPVGTAGEVEVVYYVPKTESWGETLIAVARNQTGETIQPRATVNVYTADGELISTDDDSSPDPDIVEDGGLFILYFDLDDEMSEDDTVEFLFDLDATPTEPALTISNVSVSTRTGKIIGTVTNVSKNDVNRFYVEGVCDPHEYSLDDWNRAEVSVQALKPGAAAKFSVAIACDAYIIHATQ